MAAMDGFLSIMVKMDDWTPPDFKPMRRELRGFHELRWKAGGVQHRIIGRLTGDRTFLMLIGCTHKGTVYTPPNALETAIERDRLVRTQGATTSEYEILSGR